MKLDKTINQLGFYLVNDIFNSSVQNNLIPIDNRILRFEHPTHEISHYAILPREFLKAQLLTSQKLQLNKNYFKLTPRSFDKYRGKKSARNLYKICQRIGKNSALCFDPLFPYIFLPNESGVCSYDYELRQLYGLSTDFGWKKSGWTGEASFAQLWLYGIKPSLNIFFPRIRYIYNLKNTSINCYVDKKRYSNFNLEFYNTWADSIDLEKSIYDFSLWTYKNTQEVFGKKFTEEYDSAIWQQELF